MFGHNIGIDLGTANTLVTFDGEIILREPSVVAVHNISKEVIAIGNEAKLILGRNPGNVTAIRPMRDGVIADFNITELMLSNFISKVKPRGTMFKPYVLAAVPSQITDVERRAVEESVIRAGARDVSLVDECRAAAIGLGLPIEEPTGRMVVDIGGGTTEIAIMSLGGVVTQRSIKIGGDQMDDSIIQHIKERYEIITGVRTAEEIKIKIGNVGDIWEDNPKSILVRGRSQGGLPKSIDISSLEIAKALQNPIDEIMRGILSVLEVCPPELSGDLIESGIHLAGGGALLHGLDKFISNKVNLPVFVNENSLNVVALGTAKILQMANYRRMVELDNK